jgi:neutral trehalase
MWDEQQDFYFDLDIDGNRLPQRTIAAFWTLLAEIPHEDRAAKLIETLKDEKHFGTPNPFPTLSASDPDFDRTGNGYNGSVFPALTFMVIKGLEKYGQSDLAREAAIKHIYYILDTLHPDAKEKGSLWEAYLPTQDGAALWAGREDFNRQNYLHQAGLSSIALMIENVVGLYISLPRKTVDWIVPILELMGIENLSLKRNYITILSSKSGRGWEIRLESEKLYYFTINILGKKKKTLPIPSGKCSMLLEKL